MFAQPWRFLILQPQEEIKGKLCQQLQQEGHHRFQSLYNKVLTLMVTSFKKIQTYMIFGLMWIGWVIQSSRMSFNLLTILSSIHCSAAICKNYISDIYIVLSYKFYTFWLLFAQMCMLCIALIKIARSRTYIMTWAKAQNWLYTIEWNISIAPITLLDNRLSETFWNIFFRETQCFIDIFFKFSILTLSL